MPMNTNQQVGTFTGAVLISVANPNLNGTGVLGPLFTASKTGTIVQRLSIKAIGTTTQGIIRVFLDKGASGIFLIMEIPIRPRVPSGVMTSAWASVRTNIPMLNGDILKVSTQNAEPFTVTALGIEWDNCDCDCK